MNRTERLAAFHRLLTERIVLLDGGMGTMIQGYKLTEADYRGEQFKDWPCDLKGNSDILVLTRPEIIKAIHSKYLESGADIVETNTFTANYSSQADYQMEHLVREINMAGARNDMEFFWFWRCLESVLTEDARVSVISGDEQNRTWRNPFKVRE